MNDSAMNAWLENFIAEHGGIAGTVHVRSGDALAIAASRNVPAKVVEVTRIIPKGKGMAGLAWERGRPVSSCNIQTDESGDVRPGARAVDAQAAVALPVHDTEGNLRAVVGIAFAEERTLEDRELAELGSAAAGVIELIR
ncbi:MAG: GAF domain-containing protein [Pseudomonadota bacterium]|nr:MAG: hypothetical protein DIU78_00065 [Pseudomonadota bacterium]